MSENSFESSSLFQICTVCDDNSDDLITICQTCYNDLINEIKKLKRDKQQEIEKQKYVCNQCVCRWGPCDSFKEGNGCDHCCNCNNIYKYCECRLCEICDRYKDTSYSHDPDPKMKIECQCESENDSQSD